VGASLDYTHVAVMVFVASISIRHLDCINSIEPSKGSYAYHHAPTDACLYDPASADISNINRLSTRQQIFPLGLSAVSLIESLHGCGILAGLHKMP